MELAYNQGPVQYTNYTNKYGLKTFCVLYYTFWPNLAIHREMA